MEESVKPPNMRRPVPRAPQNFEDVRIPHFIMIYRLLSMDQVRAEGSR